jgi:hypothetical protein
MGRLDSQLVTSPTTCSSSGCSPPPLALPPALIRLVMMRPAPTPTPTRPRPRRRSVRIPLAARTLMAPPREAVQLDGFALLRCVYDGEPAAV